MSDKKQDQDILSDDDLSLWQRVAATVKRSLPLPPELAEKDIKADVEKPARAEETPPPDTPPQTSNAPKKHKPQGTQIDARTMQRLRQGKIAIDETIDLHGMTQEQAHGLLVRRVTSAQKNGKRLILVITGKGLRSGAGGGVLKNALPLWCEMPPLSQIILQRITARPQHGGSGAVYLYLRRHR